MKNPQRKKKTAAAFLIEKREKCRTSERKTWRVVGRKRLPAQGGSGRRHHPPGGGGGEKCPCDKKEGGQKKKTATKDVSFGRKEKKKKIDLENKAKNNKRGEKANFLFPS